MKHYTGESRGPIPPDVFPEFEYYKKDWESDSSGWVVRTNLVTNPLAAINVSGWSGLGLVSGPTRVFPENMPSGVGTADTAIEATSNSSGDRIYAPILIGGEGLVVGKTYTASVYIELTELTATGIKLSIRKAALGSVQASSATFSTLGDWARIDFSWVATALEAQRLCIEQIDAGTAKFKATGFLFEEADALDTYFPTPNQLALGLASYTDTEHASISQSIVPKYELPSPATQEFYGFLEAFVEHDEDTDWQTLKFAESIMGGTVQTVFAWVTDREDMVGWAYLFNADKTDAAALPWLAQLNGTHLREDMTELEQREAIKEHAGFDRGTPAAIEGAPANYLTGTKVVYLREREEEKPYHIHVRTLDSETPDKAKVLEALLLQKPAGITMDYDTIIGQDWLDLKGKHATWDDVKASYTDWDDVRSTAP